ncbi:hypothetical protein [Ornithinibacillus halotolerans]|uniref:VCBS repeat-containing protein n=1 Tax=Ornithinibacillus halotolerans TaxID=1274357 RepID=A0A916S0P8_9BACI|nr:hypothetical protein [Ornithinibacillus halotolerans]GGA76337.1 hypothetical protein GCM10008025_19920 [Ornithinibacillus halotolerans]
MKRITISVLVLCLLFLMDNYSIYSEENPAPTLNVIKNYEEDVTGNGLKEIIELKGLLFSPDSNYYKDIKAVITSSENQIWEIPYLGGYEPSLTFIDLNHDKVNDVFFQSASGGSGGLYQYQLHTLIHNKLSEIPLPEQPYVIGKFQDNYVVEVTYSPNSKPINVDVKHRKEDYTRLGIYSKDGKLTKPLSAMVAPIAYFEPKFISKTKGYGLKSYQQVSGAFHADQLGTVESLWYYDRDKWILLQAKWMPSK